MTDDQALTEITEALRDRLPNLTDKERTRTADALIRRIADGYTNGGTLALIDHLANGDVELSALVLDHVA